MSSPAGKSAVGLPTADDDSRTLETHERAAWPRGTWLFNPSAKKTLELEKENRSTAATAS